MTDTCSASTRPELDWDAIELKSGGHSPGPDMCIMEAVAYAAGEPWTASPKCASPVLAAFLRNWNDSLPDDERQQLRQYGPRLAGSVGTAEQEVQRSWMALDWLIRVQTPAWLRLAGLTAQADVLANMGEVTAETRPSIRPALEAVRVDAAAAWAAAWDAARDAAWDAARDAAWAAARAAAWDAAWAAARAAAGDAAGAAAGAAARAAAWDAAAAGAAARAAAWDAAWAAARDAAWAAARAAARDAARDAAWAALRPTRDGLIGEAHVLVERMLAVTEVPA